MGPYSRGTSHTTGAFLEAFYEQPLLMVGLVLAVAGIAYYFYRKKK
jgi:LPXTG-motif cell wall-anchored protein